MTPEPISVEESLNQLRIKSAALRQMSAAGLADDRPDHDLGNWAAHAMIFLTEEIFELANRLNDHLSADVLNSKLKGVA